MVRITTRTAVERVVGADPAGGLEPVAAGHADVHEHDVGSVLEGDHHRLVAVARFADHLDVVLGVEQRAEPAADECLVVRQHHADHR